MVRTLLLLTLLIFASTAYSATPLAVGKESVGSLSRGGESSHFLRLGSDFFVYGAAIQKSVDVIIVVTGPGGEAIGEFDITGEGPDYFRFNTSVAGDYTFTVKPFEDGAGDYSLLIYMAEPVATTAEGKVDQLLVSLANENTPGAVVAVVEGGEISFQKAYGMANLSHAIPFRVDTVTNIGSTSKQFTAFAINLLAKEGKLAIDDDVRKHIPELPDFGEVVTIGHLLSHTSGYREFLNSIAMSGRMLDEGDYIDRDEILDLVMRQPGLQNSPGAEWNYCNTGFSLLALIVERVSDKTFDIWMKENVFVPLGMKDSTVRAHRGDVIRNSAQGYVQRNGNPYHEVPDIAGATGAGGIYTTVTDLALWMRNLHSGELGGKELIERMTTPYVLTDGESSGYGMGLFVDEYRGLRRIQHGGADSAHRSMFMYFPDIDKGVIVLSNNGGFSTDGAAQIADDFFEEYMAAEDDEPGEASDGFDAAEFAPADFDEFVGRFELEGIGLVIEFSRDGDKFHGQATGQPRFDLVPTADLEFNIVQIQVPINFHRDDEGVVGSLTLHQGGGIEGHRIADQAWEPSVEELVGFAGRYFSEEFEAYFEIELREGELVLQHRRLRDRTLKAAKPNIFTSDFPLGEMSFLRNESGEVTGFTANNGRTRNVLFERVGG